jgi:hypothetical protein
MKSDSKLTRVQLAEEYQKHKGWPDTDVYDAFLAGWAARGVAEIEILSRHYKRSFMGSVDLSDITSEMKALDE